jgi:hypothetical protein
LATLPLLLLVSGETLVDYNYQKPHKNTVYSDLKHIPLEQLTISTSSDNLQPLIFSQSRFRQIHTNLAPGTGNDNLKKISIVANSKRSESKEI